MVIEQISDINYKEFKQSPRAALVVGASYCQACKGYDPIVAALGNNFPFVRIGKTVLDKDRSIQLKIDYRDIGTWTLPTTLLFRDGKEISRIKGSALYPKTLTEFTNSLILGSIVYISERGTDIPGKVKHIVNCDGNYLIQLMRDCSWGRKDTIVELPKEKFKWGLETKV